MVSVHVSCVVWVYLNLMPQVDPDCDEIFKGKFAETLFRGLMVQFPLVISCMSFSDFTSEICSPPEQGSGWLPLYLWLWTEDAGRFSHLLAGFRNIPI